VGERDVEFKAQGSLGGRTAVSGRIVLERYNLSDERPLMAETDAFLRNHQRSRLTLLYHPQDPALTGEDPSLMAAPSDADAGKD
jgi:hypothetical protein